VSLQVFLLLLIFVCTLVANFLGAVYQKQVIKGNNFKAAMLSVITAGLGILIWKTCLTEVDIGSSASYVSAYLVADGIGTYIGLRTKA
jgi:hypothetical protein